MQEPGREHDCGNWALGKWIGDSGDHAVTGGVCSEIIQVYFHLRWAGRPTQICRPQAVEPQASCGNNLFGESKTQKMVLSQFEAVVHSFIHSFPHPSFCPFIISSILPSSSFIHTLIYSSLKYLLYAWLQTQNRILAFSNSQFYSKLAESQPEIVQKIPCFNNISHCQIIIIFLLIFSSSQGSRSFICFVLFIPLLRAVPGIQQVLSNY